MINKINSQTENKWEENISKNKFILAQQSILIKRIIEETYSNCKPLYFYDDKNGAGYPFFLINSKIFGKRIISLPFFDVGGFFGKVDKKDLEDIIHALKKEKKVKFIEVKINNFLPSFEQQKELLKNQGFEITKTKNQYIIKLAKEKEMWSNFHKHTRNDIRKAEKSGLIVKRIKNMNELKEYYSLYLKNMHDFGTPQHSYNYFKNSMKILKEKFVGLNCYYKDNLIASLIGIYEKDCLYVAFNVSNPKYREYRPNDILYWTVIKMALNKKLKYLDLGQIDLGAEFGTHAYGLLKFKEKWLGKVYTKFYFTYSFEKLQKSRLEKDDKYKKFRVIWKKLPLSFIKIIGPGICAQLGI